MTREPKAKPGPKQAKSAERRARLGQELRANLLKRKAQARAKKDSPQDGDEGRQS
jgi:hypothetical protein